MIRRHSSPLAIAVLLGALALFGGMSGVGLGQQTGRVNDLRFSEQEELTRLTVLFEGPLDYLVIPNMKEKWIELQLIHTSIVDDFLGMSYSDGRIEKIEVTRATADQVAVRIFLRSVNSSFYHHRYETPPSVSLDIRSRQGVIQMNFGPEGMPEDLPPEDAPVVVAGFDKGIEEPKEAEPAIAPTPIPFEPLLTPEEEAEFNAQTEFAAREEYVNALKIFQDRKYKQAAALLSDFIQFNPESPHVEDAYFLLGDAMFEIVKREKILYRENIDVYRVASSKFPESPKRQKARLRIGDLYRFQNLLLEAKGEYGNLIRRFPDSPYVAQVLVSRSSIYLEEKKYQRALNDLERVLLIHPFSTAARDAKFQIAQAFFEQNDFATAMEIFEKTAKRFPTYPKRRPTILFQIAESFFQVQRYKEALSNFIDVVNLFPLHELAPKAVNRVGDTYMALGKKKAGVQMYASTIHRYPGKEETITAQLKLENIRIEDPTLVPSQPVFQVELEEDPLKVYQRIIQKAKKGPDEMEAYYRKSLVYADRNRYGEAVLTLKRLLSKYPEGTLSEEAFEEVRLNLFHLINNFYDQEGFFVVLFTYVEHFDPFLKEIVRPNILVKIADSFRRMGLWDRALETYDRVLEYDPKGTWNEHVELNKTRIHLQKDQYGEAEKSARIFTFRHSGSPLIVDAEFLLAEALYSQNRFGEAIEQFHHSQDVLRANPPKRERGILPTVILRLPYYEFLLANSYKETGRNNLAVIHYQRAIQSFMDLQKAELELRSIEVPEPFFVVQSRYQIVDSLYLMDQYRRAIQEAQGTLDQYPEKPNSSWLRYIISASFRALNQDEDSTNELNELLAKDQSSIVSKVAESKIQTQEWEKKNSSLFAF